MVRYRHRIPIRVRHDILTQGALRTVIGASVVATLALTGCAAGPVDAPAPGSVETDNSPSEPTTESAPSPPQTEATEEATGAFTESGFPRAEESNVSSQFSGLAGSIVKVGDEFSSGTGWVFDANHVVTNWHVVDFMAEPITMETYDGGLLYGTVIATEEFDDIAVIRLDQATSLKPLPRAISAPVAPEPVFFIGHPGSIGDWITGVGVVSESDEFFPEFITTTLPVDEGASGSPMFNLQGEVVALISGCMYSQDAMERPLGDGSRLYSVPPTPPISDNCGGTDITQVTAFVEATISGQ